MRPGMLSTSLALMAPLLGCNDSDLPALPATVIVEGRLIDADGSPAPSRDVSVSRCGPVLSLEDYLLDFQTLAGREIARVSTDQQGMYRIQVNGTQVESPRGLNAICAAVLGPEGPDGERAWARIEDSTGRGQFSLPDMPVGARLSVSAEGQELVVSWPIGDGSPATMYSVTTVRTDQGTAWMQPWDHAGFGGSFQLRLPLYVLEDFGNPQMQAVVMAGPPDLLWLTLFQRSDLTKIRVQGTVAGSRGASCAPVPGGACPLTDGALAPVNMGTAPVVLALSAPLEARYIVLRGVDGFDVQDYELLVEASTDGISYYPVGRISGVYPQRQPYQIVTLSTAFAASFYRLTPKAGQLAASEISLFP